MKKALLLIALVVLVVPISSVAKDLVGSADTLPKNVQKAQLTRAPGDVLIYESFEDGVPPTGWTVMTSGNSTTWVQLEAGNTGAFSAGVLYGGQGEFQDEWIVTPALNTVGMDAMFLQFAEMQQYWADYGLDHSVMVSTTVPDDPAAFSPVLVMSPRNHPIGDGWQMTDVVLTDYVGLETVYFALRYRGDWADNWLVDDFKIFQPFDHDIAALDMQPTEAVAAPGEAVTPVMTVKNVGANAETFNVQVMIYDTYGGSVYMDNRTVTDLASGATEVVTFTDFSAIIGGFTVAGDVLLENDGDPSNNSQSGAIICGDQPRTPFGMLFTNWGCGPCVSCNQALDDYYPTLGNDGCLIRVHSAGPSAGDPFYDANVEESTYLIDVMPPAGVTGVPTLYMDNINDMWDFTWANWVEGVEMGYAMSTARPSPLLMDVMYNPETGQVDVVVDIRSNLVAGVDYILNVAVTEDNFYAPGPNGEEYHSQGFRKLYPGTQGTPIDSAVGLNIYTVDIPVDQAWVYENLRVTAWVQTAGRGGVVHNSATMFLSEGVVSNGEGEDEVVQTPTYRTQLKGNTPNPFNPATKVALTLDRSQHVDLAIYDLSGRKVAVLANGVYGAGVQEFRWNGKNSAGMDVASGTYLVKMQTEDKFQTSKMMLVR